MAIKFQGFTHTAGVQPSDLRPIIEQKGKIDSLQQIDLEKFDTCSNGIDFSLEKCIHNTWNNVIKNQNLSVMDNEA